MRSSQLIKEVSTWSNAKQSTFCKRIIFSVTIGIRDVLANDEVGVEEKLETVKWINEFHHQVYNVQRNISNASGMSDPIKRIGELARYYASKSRLAGAHIAAILRLSYRTMIRELDSEAKN